jgi:hypothetical protein
MASKVERMVAKAMSVGCATSVSQPEFPIGATVPMCSWPSSEKTIGPEVPGKTRLHQRQVGEVFLTCSRTSIRMRDDLPEAVDDDRQHGGGLAEFHDMRRQLAEIDFTHQHRAGSDGQRCLATQRHGDGDDDLATLRQVAVRPHQLSLECLARRKLRAEKSSPSKSSRRLRRRSSGRPTSTTRALASRM